MKSVPVASVIVPTHDRDSTLPLTIASIQSQTVRDIEIMIVGDGVTPAVRALVQGLAGKDDRIRFLDFEKAPGRGYANRHQALLEAAGGHIFYSDDDDLWLPDHVERLGGALAAGADVASSTVLSVARSGRTHHAYINPSNAIQRERLATTSVRKTIFDTHFAHSRELYARIGDAWEGGPDELLSRCAAADAVWTSYGRPTALSMHGSTRSRESPAARHDEARRIANDIPGFLAAGGASGAWYLHRTMAVLPPRPFETFQAYSDRLGNDFTGTSGSIVSTGGPMHHAVSDDVLADMAAAYALSTCRVEDSSRLSRIILPLAEPILGPAPGIPFVVRLLREALPIDRVGEILASIEIEKPGDDEMKVLLLARLAAVKGDLEAARAQLEKGVATFTRYATDAGAMLADLGKKPERPRPAKRAAKRMAKNAEEGPAPAKYSPLVEL